MSCTNQAVRSEKTSVPWGWTAGAGIGALLSAAGLYTAIAAKNKLKKIRIQRTYKPRNIVLRDQQDTAEKRVFWGSSLATLAGILTAVSAYKVGMIMRKQPGTVPAVSSPLPAVGGGSQPKKETREGYDSKGNLLPGWGQPNESAAQAPSLKPRPADLPPHFGWDSVTGQAWYEGAKGRVYSWWDSGRPVEKQEDNN
jgi:hypothetical protein